VLLAVGVLLAAGVLLAVGDLLAVGVLLAVRVLLAVVVCNKYVYVTFFFNNFSLTTRVTLKTTGLHGRQKILSENPKFHRKALKKIPRM
jgi:hypothetical protein